jgi:hypothetical protein
MPGLFARQFRSRTADAMPHGVEASILAQISVELRILHGFGGFALGPGLSSAGLNWNARVCDCTNLRANDALLPCDWFCVTQNSMPEKLWHLPPRSFCGRKSPTSDFRIAAVRTSSCTFCQSHARTCNNTAGSWVLKTKFETGSQEPQRKLKSAGLQCRRLAVVCGLF